MQPADSPAKMPYPLRRLDAQQRYDERVRSEEKYDTIMGIELKWADWHVRDTESLDPPDDVAGRMPVILAYTMP